MSKEKNNTDNTIKSSTDRRKVLKGAVTGSAIAGAVVWKKPVVDAVLTPAHAQTSNLTVSVQAEAFDGDNPTDDAITPFQTVDTGPGGSATISTDSTDDDLYFSMNITVSPPQSIPVQVSWTNTDALDSPSLGGASMVQTFDNGTAEVSFASDSLADANGVDEAQITTITFDNAAASPSTTVTLDFS